MIGDLTLCDNCKHRDFSKPGARCSAYPGGIPSEISEMGLPHTEIFPDQTGTDIYEPIKPDLPGPDL